MCIKLLGLHLENCKLWQRLDVVMMIIINLHFPWFHVTLSSFLVYLDCSIIYLDSPLPHSPCSHPLFRQATVKNYLVAEIMNTFMISKSALKSYHVKLKRGDCLIQNERERKLRSPILEISLKTPTVPSTGFCISAWCLIDAFDQTGEKSSSTSHAGLGWTVLTNNLP